MTESSVLMPERAGAAESALAARATIVLGFLVYLSVVAAAWWGILRFLPDHLHVAVHGRAFDLRNVHRRIVDDGVLMSLLLPAALWIECWVVGWNRSSARQLLVARTASAKTDLAYFLLGQPHLTDLIGKLTFD